LQAKDVAQIDARLVMVQKASQQAPLELSPDRLLNDETFPMAEIEGVHVERGKEVGVPGTI
jgi:hypothetical protein